MRGKKRNKVSSKQQIKLPIIVILICSSILFIFSVIFALTNLSNKSIISGVSINQCDVSHLTLEQAKEKVEKKIKDKIETGIQLTYHDASYTLDLAILDIKFDLEAALNEVNKLGRSGNIIQDNYSILKCLLLKQNIEVQFEYNQENLRKELENIYHQMPERVVENSYYREDDELIIVKGIDGIKIQTEALVHKINLELNNLSSEKAISIPVEQVKAEALNVSDVYHQIFQEAKDAYYTKEPFQIYPEVEGVDFGINLSEVETILAQNNDTYIIPLKITPPKIKAEDLDIDVFPDLLGKQDSKYDVTNRNRTNNLEIAASRLNGVVIEPGKTFSYNKTLGARNIANGYKEAAIYANGKVVDGLGGGICQLSSVLYDAVLYANLEIEERENHQFMPGYVQPGLDATVVYGSIDFKFKNNRTYPVQIQATVRNGIARISIYGIKEEKDYTVELHTQIVEATPYNTNYVIDSSLGDGEQVVLQSGQNGMVVETYKILKFKDMEVSRTLISKDHYKPLEKVISIKEKPTN